MTGTFVFPLLEFVQNKRDHGRETRLMIILGISTITARWATLPERAVEGHVHWPRFVLLILFAPRLLPVIDKNTVDRLQLLANLFRKCKLALGSHFLTFPEHVINKNERVWTILGLTFHKRVASAHADYTLRSQ